MDIEEEVQVNGVENMLNRVRAEDFLNLEKEMVIQVQEHFRTSKQTRPEKNFPKAYYS
jgi:hypothetical protein